MNALYTKLMRFKESFLPSQFLDEIEQTPSLVEMIQNAKEEWLDAKEFFEEVTDPVLIDHAIHRMESAEKRYIYLLKLAHQEKIINEKVELN
ncbi:MAG: DUF2508 family protein [Bacillota bacterium]